MVLSTVRIPELGGFQMLADGGECVSDLGAVREQEVLFGSVASDSTAFKMIQKIAGTPGMLDAVRGARAVPRRDA